MKKPIIGLIAILIQVAGFSQGEKDLVRISEDIELIKLTDHAFIHVSYRNSPEYGRVGANGLIITDQKQAFLFDTPWTEKQTATLISWI